MKVMLKWLLIAGILLVGVYTASPFWLPYVLQDQLPTGWELEELDLDYPGLSGISINKLRLKGDALPAGIELTATGARFEYQSRDTQVSSLTLDVSLPADANPGKPFSLDDLSLPLIRIPPGLQLPEILVQQLRLNLHYLPGAEIAGPLVMDFDGFALKPSQENGYHLVSGLSMAGFAGVGGQLEVEINATSFTIDLIFSDAGFPDPWLTLSLEQLIQQVSSKSEIKVDFSAVSVDRAWLDSLLSQASAGRLQHAEGSFLLQAGFSGDNEQKFSRLEFSSEGLQLENADETFELDTGLQARNESGSIQVKQEKTTKIYYQGRTNAGLLASILPELQHVGDSRQFIDIRANNFQLEFGGIHGRDLVRANGLLKLHWLEESAFRLESAGFLLQADDLELETLGKISVLQQQVNFEHLDNLDLRLKNMQLVVFSDDSQIKLSADSSAAHAGLDFSFSLLEPGLPLDFDVKGKMNLGRTVMEFVEGSEAQMVAMAKSMILSPEFSSRAGTLLSSGTASLVDAEISQLNKAAASASMEKLELNWQQLDLLNLAGGLDTRTQGLVLNVDGESWQGFNLDLRSRLGADGKVGGSGKVLFDTDPAVSMDYRGSLESEKWQVKVPDANIEVSRLRALMRMAHIELPDILKLSHGKIRVSADVSIADEISATALLKGEGIGLSILENTVVGGSFEFNAVLAGDLKLKGLLAVTGLDVAGGVDVRNIGVDLMIDGTESVQADKLRAELFGGNLEPASLHYLNGVIEDSILKLNGMDLQLLLAFADIDGLEGSGSLDISLPIGTDAGGLFVRNATFSSSKPGHLVYLSGAPGSNIGLQALENFQYEDLSGTLNYQSDGNYQILISLKGSNPDMYGGHPISFNLTISGSLPELFEALFVTGSFEDGIIKQIRSN